MTKLKNTKKGMAKKALSISLVAAMLATSNVPVWAAEDLFSDGGAAVEAPAVEEPAAEVDTFSAEPVEEADVLAASVDVTANGYKVTASNIEENGWGKSVTVDDFSVKKGDKDVNSYSYVWLVDGVQGNGENAAGTNVNSLGMYKPLYAEYGKELSLRIYIEDAGQQLFNEVIKVGTISERDFNEDSAFTNYGSLSAESNEYNGTEQKPTVNLEEPLTLGGKSITEDDWIISYEGDFTNVNNEAKVILTLNKPGMTASKEFSYEITKKNLELSDLDITLKTTSVPYTGNQKLFSKDDLVIKDKYTNTDLTSYIKEAKGTGTIVGKDYNVNVTFDTTSPEATNAFANYNVAGSITLSDTYEITKRDLAMTKAVVNRDYACSEITSSTVISNEDVTVTDAVTGEKITLGTSVTVEISEEAMAAAKAGTVGVVSDGVIITVKGGSNFKDSTVTADLRLSNQTISNATVQYDGKNVASTSTEANDASYYSVEYDGTAKELASDKLTIKVGSTTLTKNDYTITYDTDNINAGIVKATITGLQSYSGSSKTIYFKITPVEVMENDAKYNNKVTLNRANDEDASGYATSVALKLTAENKAEKTFELVEGKDYTVKYIYVGADNETEIPKNGNAVGNRVEAEVVFTENGNFKSTDSLKFYSTIANKSISDVTIELDADSYTYTGKTITPVVTVKDNGVVVSEGEYKISYSNAINVGTATVMVEAIDGGSYDPGTTASKTFTITPADAKDVTVNLNGDTTYTGQQIKPSVDTITFNGVDVKDCFDVENLVYGENINAGTDAGSVTINAKENNNFTGSVTKKFTIAAKKLTGTLKVYDSNGTDITDSIDTTNVVYNYDGTARTFDKVVFTPDDKDAVEGKDYEITYFNNVYGDADDVATICVVAKGSYSGGYTNNGDVVDENGNKVQNIIEGTVKQFKINPLNVDASNVKVSNGSYAGGIDVKPDVQITFNGKILTEGQDYELVFPEDQDRYNATDKNNLTVTVKMINGYENGKGNFNFTWGIDKKDLKDTDITLEKTEDGTYTAIVLNGIILVKTSEYTITDNGDGTVTVAANADSKNYTGSKTIDVELEDEKPAAPVISEVKVNGNNATVVLAGESDGATGYDYVISTDRDCITTKDYDKVNKNMLTTETTFTYTEQGIYYAYCHSWKRVDGVKVFSDWSEAYPFSVTSITPEQPVITKLEKSSNGKHLRVTWTQCENATGYDVVMGTKLQKVNGEYRPTEYGKAVKKVTNGNTVSVIFYNIPSGTYYVGLHAYNRTSETGVKVFSPWSNSKEVKF